MPVDSASPLPSLAETLERLEALIRERDLERSKLLDPNELAAKAALPEHVVRALLRGGSPPEDTVNERVRARIRAYTETRLEQTGQRMADLVGSIVRQLGVSSVWARHVLAGDKMPSVELLHGLVEFFHIEGDEAFFTAPAADALNRVLMPVLAAQQAKTPRPEEAPDPLTAARAQFDDVRSIALRQARDLPPERWKVLNATLNALLELDEDDESEEPR